MLIKQNMDVEYESTHTPGRKFVGRVLAVYEGLAIVRWTVGMFNQHYYTHVACTRLKPLPPKTSTRTTHKGRTA